MGDLARVQIASLSALKYLAFTGSRYSSQICRLVFHNGVPSVSGSLCPNVSFHFHSRLQQLSLQDSAANLLTITAQSPSLRCKVDESLQCVQIWPLFMPCRRSIFPLGLFV